MEERKDSSEPTEESGDITDVNGSKEKEKNEPEEVEEDYYYEVIEEYIEEDCSEEGYSGEECIEEVIEEESIEEVSDREEIKEMDSKLTTHAGKEQHSVTSLSLPNSCKKKRKIEMDADIECKKHKQEISPTPKSDSAPTNACQQDSIEKSKTIVSDDVSKEHGSAGSPGNKKRSRWDFQSENPEVLSCNDEVSKRKKTRWASDENQLKMLGPLQLPDLTKSLNCGKHDPVIQELNEQLMKINEKLLRPEITDSQTEKTSPSPKYDDIGVRINTREMRLCAKLVKKKAKIISKMVCRNLQFAVRQEDAPLKFHKKLYVPAKEYPEINFVGLIIGPRGNTLKRMEIETGARIFLRGKGSVRESHEKKNKQPVPPSHTDNDDLHVLIETDNQKSLDAAVKMVEKLLVPLEEMRTLKMAQLRELALINGKIKSSSCDTCGDPGHLTSYCPLTAPAIGNETDDNSVYLLGEPRGPGIFSFTNGQGPASTSYGLPTKETDSTNIYVGYLSQSVDDAALQKLFCTFGIITNLKVIKDRATGLSKGYGFVRFDNPASAAKAVEHMNRFQLEDKKLAVRIAGIPPNADSARPNSVRNLPIFPGPPAVPRPMSGVAGFSGPPLYIMPGSCSYFPQNTEAFTRPEYMLLHSNPSPSRPSLHDPAVLPGPLVSMTPVSCTYLLQTTGSFSQDDHRPMRPPAYYVPYSAPVVLPSIPGGRIFTSSEFANFTGNPDKYSHSESQSSLFSSSSSGSQLPDSKVVNILRNPCSPPSSSSTYPSAASSRGVANYTAKLDHEKSRFYG